jgi:glucan biosynthesis protein C
MSPTTLNAASKTAQGGERYCGLDALRAFASVLVVVLHAGIPYMAGGFPGLIWCIRDDAARSAVVTAICWKIDTFIMPLFFVMGGFLACHSGQRSGPVTLVKNRLVRLGAPFALALVVILPIDLYVWLVGWVIEDRIHIRKLKSLKVGSDLRQSIDGVAHLWFLEYLLIFCVAAGAALWVMRRFSSVSPRPGTPGRGTGGEWLHILAAPDTIRLPQARSAGRIQGLTVLIVSGLFLTSVAGLAMEPRVVIGFRSTYLPHLANILYYAPCFALGWLWKAKSLRTPTRSALAMILASIGLFAVMLPRLLAHVVTPATGTNLIGLAALFTACGWLATSGWFALALNWKHSIPASVAYLGKASMWVYLVHHPVCGLTQIALRPIEINGVWKTSLTALTTLTFCLLTYEAFVRNRWLDKVINGTSQRPALPAIEEPKRIAA